VQIPISVQRAIHYEGLHDSPARFEHRSCETVTGSHPVESGNLDVGKRQLKLGFAVRSHVGTANGIEHGLVKSFSRLVRRRKAVAEVEDRSSEHGAVGPKVAGCSPLALLTKQRRKYSL
jgi:hypothetical protein